ncbi:MAG: DUF6273 domain-containing protein, partial [Coprococcus sp.]
MKNRRKNVLKKAITLVITFVMMLVLLPVITPKEAANVQAATLQEPRKNSNGKVIYDCVWFGSYPQAEVITTEMRYNYVSTCSGYVGSNDLIVDNGLYYTLQKAGGWDKNGDITLTNGDKYRRIKKSDVYNYDTFDDTGDCSIYKWSDESTYHYFKYQPIKWKVLSLSGDEMMLMSDKALNTKKYNNTDTGVTWSNCSLRSWLNGYNGESDSFIGCAFNTDEKSAIYTSRIKNNINPRYGTIAGEDTFDKVYLLSSTDITNSDYGFSSEYDKYDNVRYIKASTYARATGSVWYPGYEYFGNVWCWLRTPGSSLNSTMRILCSGYIDQHGDPIYDFYSVVPVLSVKLSANKYYSYAGIACTDGTYNEVKARNGLISAKDGTFYYKDNRIQNNYTGLILHTDKTWCYVKNGKWQSNYTGMVKNTNGRWYYVEKGKKKYVTQLVKYTDGNWWYVKNGEWQPNYTGMVKQPSGKWYYVENGKKKYISGLVKHTDGSWWHVKNGEWQPNYTGMVRRSSGKWYYVEKGKKKYVTQLVQHTDGNWWYVKDGEWQPNYTGMVKQPSGKWY